MLEILPGKVWISYLNGYTLGRNIPESTINLLRSDRGERPMEKLSRTFGKRPSPATVQYLDSPLTGNRRK